MEMMRLAALLAASAVLMAAQAPSGGSVEGKVISAASLQPLKRAYVVVRGISAGQGAPAVEMYICQTDPEGRFTVSGMAPGRYEVEASHDGFQAKPPERAPSPVYFPQFTVEAGQRITGIELKLTPLGMVAGIVTSDRGDPVPRTTVEALQNRYTAGKKVLRRVQQAQTDDRGIYRFSDLPPGRYYLRATNGNQDPPIMGGIETRGPARSRIYMPSYYPAGQDAAAAAVLDVAPAADLEHIDLRMHRTFVYSIRGTAPAGAQTSIVRQPGGPGFAYGTMTGKGPNRDGFEIFGLPPGKYPVRAMKSAALFAFRRVEITDQDVEGVDLTHSTGRDIIGQVQYAGPVSALRVSLQPEDPNSGTDADCAVNADGSFTLSGQPDAYLVRVQAPEGAYLKTVRVGDRERPDHRLDPGADSGKLTLMLASDTGKIEGTVTGADGKPAARALVTLIPDQSLPFWADLAKTGSTGAGGGFAFAGVAPGAYRLFAWTDVENGAPQDPDFRKPFEAQGVPVQVDSSGSVAVNLTAIDPQARQ